MVRLPATTLAQVAGLSVRMKPQSSIAFRMVQICHLMNKSRLILLFSMSISAPSFGAIKQLYESADIRIFWQDSTEMTPIADPDGQHRLAERVARVVRPYLDKITQWDQGKYGGKGFLPINVVLRSGENVHTGLAHFARLSYTDLKGEAVKTAPIRYVTLGAPVETDSDSSISHGTMHEIGHNFSFYAKIGKVAVESYADFFAMIVRDNDPYHNPTYERNLNNFASYTREELNWMQITSRKAMRNFADDYEYANSLRFARVGHFISPVINSAFHRLAKIVQHDKLFRAVTDTIFTTTVGYGSSAKAWMDEVIRRVSPDVAPERMSEFKHYLQAQGWRDPLPTPHLFSTNWLRTSDLKDYLEISAWQDLYDEIENLGKVATVNLYTRDRIVTDYWVVVHTKIGDWKPVFTKTQLTTGDMNGKYKWYLEFQFGYLSSWKSRSDSCEYDYFDHCRALPINNREYGVSISYVDRRELYGKLKFAALHR